MSNSVYVTKLVDEEHKVTLLLHEVDLSTRESTIDAVKEIRKEAHTPEDINGILGVIMAHSAEKLTDEDRSDLFQGVTPAESTEPYAISITSENYPLIYKFLSDQQTDEAKEDESLQQKKDESSTLKEDMDKLIEESAKTENELKIRIAELEKEKEDLEKSKKNEDKDQSSEVVDETPVPSADATEATPTPSEPPTETPDAVEKDSNSLVAELEAKLATACAENHGLLAKEAARISIEKQWPLAKTMTLEELTAKFVSRSDEYIRIHIADMEEATTPEVSDPKEQKPPLSTSNVEPVTDPTLHEETAMVSQDTAPLTKITDLETDTKTLRNTLYSQVTESEENLIVVLGGGDKKREADIKKKFNLNGKETN
jgi:hypothetical protein